MFSNRGLSDLERRKQELLTTSEVQRRLMRIEGAEIRTRLAWAEQAVAVARMAWPFCQQILPLWRLWSARRETDGGSWLNKVVTGFNVARQFTQLWRQFSSPPPRPDDMPPASS